MLSDEQRIPRRISPGHRVTIVSELNHRLQRQPARWGLASPWRVNQAFLFANAETACSERLYRSLWDKGRAIIAVDGWTERHYLNNVAPLFYVHLQDNSPLYLAVLYKRVGQLADKNDGFILLTLPGSVSGDPVCDRRPAAFSPENALLWLSQDTPGPVAEELLRTATVPASEFSAVPVEARSLTDPVRAFTPYLPGNKH